MHPIALSNKVPLFMENFIAASSLEAFFLNFNYVRYIMTAYYRVSFIILVKFNFFNF